MTFEGWVALVGLLLLAMALSSAWVQRLPISNAVLYLVIGMLLGPWALNLIIVDVVKQAALLLRLTEVAVVLSLFIGGLRLRLPLSHRAWRAAFRLASAVMIGCIAGTAFIGWQVFNLSVGSALLIGAILAPTDPVLASDVTVGHSLDHDRLRYALSGEAGLNDGTAFPFVILALLFFAGTPANGELWHWFLHEVLWASLAGLLVGFTLGRLVGRAAIMLRARQRDTASPTDFLALALIALSYVAAEHIGAWGFLAVFAAGVGLRRAELQTVTAEPHPDAPDTSHQTHPPAETFIAPSTVTEDEIEAPAVAAGVLVAEVFSFGDTIARILEVLLVVTVGIALATHLSAAGLMLGALLMVVVRPVMVWLGLLGTPTSPVQRLLVGWFGIRGIGSLYYLALVMTRALPQELSRPVADICVSAVGLSIICHGLSAQPLMRWYERHGKHPHKVGRSPVGV
jgi:sodium/hydrogen antiporter